MTWDQIVELTKVLGPTIVAAFSAVVVVWRFLREQRVARKLQAEQREWEIKANLEQREKENRTRLFEAAKPFREKQFALYTEATQVVGRIVVNPPRNPVDLQEISDIQRFYQLFWTELSLVEDEQVKQHMEAFSQLLIEMASGGSDFEVMNRNKWNLQQGSFRLARAIRKSIEATWNTGSLTSTPEMG